MCSACGMRASTPFWWAKRSCAQPTLGSHWPSCLPDAEAPSVVSPSQASLFDIPEPPSHGPGDVSHLRAWTPEQWAVAPDWQPTLQRFWPSPAAQGLARFVQARLDAGATIYPPQPLRALALTPLSKVRVVILGQDPYHGPGQA